MYQDNVKVYSKTDALEGIKGNKIPNLKHQITNKFSETTLN
jgi:hypothetical protein